MDIVFLGYMVPLEQMEQYTGISIAGNKMQYNIINELNKLPDITVHSVSILPYASFPKDKHVFIKETQYKYNGILCNQVFYCNLPLLKQITQIFSVYRVARKVITNLLRQNKQVFIMGFNMFPQVGLPMKWLKKYANTLCVLADLPIDDNTQRKGLSKWLRRMFDYNTKQNINSCDNYVVLSKCVQKEILKDKNSIVVEGGINDSEIIDFAKGRGNSKKAIVVYSGALTEYNGVVNLLDSMQYLKTRDVELRIYGRGYLKDYVMEMQRKDTRIQYLGLVSNDEMRCCQMEADILINPRQVDNQISKYTFPSKTFEYFLSKTIVVSTQIPSYSEEYLDKMVLAEDSPKGLAKAIEKVLSMSPDEKQELEDKAYEFVVGEKKWSTQVKKMYKFIQNI